MIERHAHTWLGWDGEKISFNDLKNKPTISSSQAWVDIQDRLVWESLNDFVVTGIWFKPKYVKIEAIRRWADTQDHSIWESYDNWWTPSNFIRYAKTWSTDQFIDTSAMIYITDTTWTQRANMLSFDADWFTLDWITNNTIDVTLKITCLW